MEPTRSSSPVEITLHIDREPQTWNAHGNTAHIQEYRECIERQYTGRSFAGPIEIECTYFLQAPRKLQNRISQGEAIPASIGGSPKLEKLNAVVIHALHHLLFGNVCQITSLSAKKIYAEHTGITIVLRGTHYGDLLEPSDSSHCDTNAADVSS